MIRLLTSVLATSLLMGCQDTLVSQLSEAQATQIETVLGQFGIETHRSLGDGQKWSVSVRPDDVKTAAEIITAYDLPHASYVSLGDLFKREGLISSPTEERVRYLYGVSQELSNTLEQINGVLLARVHVVIPEKDPTTNQSPAPSCAVLVRYRSDVNLESRRRDIRALVAAGVEGLKPEQVALALIPVTPILPGIGTQHGRHQ
ncbi:type III secretion system inner membrane ring lipoprotein SctJ [Paraburkholderia hayleyella]|uniref:type III secretion system inner membrane ring lipoprotein SctJ n=1 Tax=Paraburkholderia hayleyella TaxID=2152889 RepID=UPI001580C02D|nr:type III secretion inner membrane ring lipoprotein SctJ [Paraburkholderia hayleyella]